MTKKIFFILPALCAVTLTLSLLFPALSTDCWHDEIVTIAESTGSYGELINMLVTKDVYPPFYYSLIHVIASFLNINVNSQELFCIVPIMKLVSVIATTLSFVIIYSIIAKFRNKEAGITVCLVCLSLPHFLHYCLEVRPYALCAIFTALAFLSGIKAILDKHKGWWCVYAVCTLLNAYSHYYALATQILVTAALFTYCCIYEKKHILPLLSACFFAMILFLPWIPSLFQQMGRVQESWWCNDPLRTSYKMITNLCGSPLFGYVSPWFCILIALGIYASYKAYRKGHRLSLLIIWCGFFIIPITWATSVANSLLQGQNIIHLRYLFFGTVIFAIGVAWAASYLNQKALYLFNTFLIVIASTNLYKFQRAEWRQYRNNVQMQAIIASHRPIYAYLTPLKPDHHQNAIAMLALPSKRVSPLTATGDNSGQWNIWHPLYNKIYARPYKALKSIPTPCTIIVSDNLLPYFNDETKNLNLELSTRKHDCYNIITVTSLSTASSE